jgi:hypothetical protein
VFTAFPKDIEISYETGEVAQFPCQFEYKGRDESHVRPHWIINNTRFDSTSLPSDHFYDGKVLSVKNLKLDQNNSCYQCVVEILSDEGEVTKTCFYNSTVGRLIIGRRGEM